MKLLCSFCFLFLFSLAGLSYAGELSVFVSDGCSNFPDGPPGNPDKWRNCCLTHDKAYWLGGTYSERKQADKKLQVCIAEVENKVLANLMWAGVRAGGSPYWPTDFRWGYGWPYSRGYRALSDAELQQAEAGF